MQYAKTADAKASYQQVAMGQEATSARLLAFIEHQNRIDVSAEALAPQLCPFHRQTGAWWAGLGVGSSFGAVGSPGRCAWQHSSTNGFFRASRGRLRKRKIKHAKA